MGLRHRLWLLSGFLLFTTSAGALEPQNPFTLCERFLEGPERAKCEDHMTSLKPDWYLATVCNANFDDQSFMDCVDLTKLGSFSPEKLNDCQGDQLSDSARISCVRQALTTPAKAFQSGSTKTVPKQKHKSKKKHH